MDEAAAAAAAARERKRPREGDPAPSAAAAAREAQQVYLPIADALKAPGARVCLFAAVSEIGAAVHSRGTDFCVTLKIVDQSRTAGISATFFADNTALLPCVKSSGDVISLHNVVIAMHGEFFVLYNKKFSSFALFEGKVSKECSPYQTSMKYYGSSHDNELLTQMRTWFAYNPPVDAAVPQKRSRSRPKLCQTPPYPTEKPAKLLYLWGWKANSFSVSWSHQLA